MSFAHLQGATGTICFASGQSTGRSPAPALLLLDPGPQRELPSFQGVREGDSLLREEEGNVDKGGRERRKVPGGLEGGGRKGQAPSSLCDHLCKDPALEPKPHTLHVVLPASGLPLALQSCSDAFPRSHPLRQKTFSS